MWEATCLPLSRQVGLSSSIVAATVAKFVIQSSYLHASCMFSEKVIVRPA